MQEVKASKVLVAKLMKRAHIRSIVRKKHRVTTNSLHQYDLIENTLNRDFTAKNINQKWVSDITYIRTREGGVYLTTVIDLFDRKVVGWSLSPTMKAVDTVIPAFRMAVCNRSIDKKQALIFHSDRGIQYACDEFVKTLKSYPNIVRSMSRKGNCWDNAVAESFFKTLKTELVIKQENKPNFQYLNTLRYFIIKKEDTKNFKT